MPPIGLFPRGGPRPTNSRAEVTVYQALARALPNGWTAWHSLRVKVKREWEGEGDFVIAVPGRGLVVLEVKGGAVECRDGRWFQNGAPMDKPPRDQANRFVRGLVDEIWKRKAGPVRFDAATVFPDVAYGDEPSHADLGGATLGAQDLPYLREALQALVERLLGSASTPGTEWIEALHAMWGDTWKPRLSLGRRITVREDELVALDAEQLDFLELVQENERVLVRGGPGTGKTLLAAEAWRRLRADGARPLLLCFTSALAAALRQRGIEQAWTARELESELLGELGVAPQGGAPRSEWTPETWESVAAMAADRAVPLGRERFDAIVIDEAQDLTAADWDLVRRLAEGRRLYAFGDPGQGFWAERAIPEDPFTTRLPLKRRYRCPEPLAAFADLYRGAAPVAAPKLPDELRIVTVADAAGIEAAVAAELQRARDGGAGPGDVAVLSLAGQQRTTLCAQAEIGGVSVRRADAPDATDHVVADTFLRFKGLERPWVIVTELSRGAHRREVRMHVALTRATVGCVVVATADELAADPVLAGVVAAR